MAKIGVLKPFSGTGANLKNIVLEDGEIAFETPNEGPGTGVGSIKMGDGTTTYKNLPYFMGEAHGGYSDGTTEEDLINNLDYLEEEHLGKIYYIQAYFDGTITENVPYMVIGVNHDGTTNTVDLMSKVVGNYQKWNNSENSWIRGKYTTSNMYSWLPNTCAAGYSSNIQAKMINMTERWREATGNATGSMQSRQTKCKLLNPVELFGYSSATYSVDWQYGSTSDYKTDFASPTGAKYGTLYPVWTDSINSNTNRIVYSNLAMSKGTYSWTNSWLAFYSSISCAYCFVVLPSGSCSLNDVSGASGVAPVIRLSNS